MTDRETIHPHMHTLEYTHTDTHTPVHVLRLSDVSPRPGEEALGVLRHRGILSREL